MTSNGETIKTWTHSTMTEPMCVVVDRNYDHVLVGDSSCNIHAFKASSGQHLFTVYKFCFYYLVLVGKIELLKVWSSLVYIFMVGHLAS